MNNAEKSAYKFLKTFGIVSPSLKSLQTATEELGYTIVYFSHIVNDTDVETLLNVLNLKKFSEFSECFTYSDPHHKIIFMREGLSSNEQLILLAHELGHIYLGHLEKESHSANITSENEANEFSHSLLKKNLIREIWLTLSFNNVKTVLISVFVILLIILGVITTYNKGEDKYCITSSGERYHLPTCETIQEYNFIYGTEREFKKLGKTPCGVCLK